MYCMSVLARSRKSHHDVGIWGFCRRGNHRSIVSLFITAANGDTEGGAPTTILEAQALGLPILASTHADIPNITVPGLSASLAPERDSAALAAALANLLDDRPSWSRMGEAGREFVATHHDVSREVARLEDRYLSLMGTSVQ